MKPGDHVTAKSGVPEHDLLIETVKYIPGMPQYDKHTFLDHNKGFLTESGWWLHQEDYFVVWRNPTNDELGAKIATLIKKIKKTK